MSGAGAGKKVKRRKKLTKAQRAELERKREEERIRREQEERERLEAERREIEERERRLREEQERRRQQEKERRDVEFKEVADWVASRQKWLRDHDASEQKSAEWERYRACLPRPNADNEAEINTFMRLWRENDWDNLWRGRQQMSEFAEPGNGANSDSQGKTLAAEGRDGSSDASAEYQKEREFHVKVSHGKHGGLMREMEMAQQVQDIIYDLDDLLSSAEERDENDKIALYAQKKLELRELVQERLNYVTVDILQHADEYANQRNEVKIAVKQPDYRLGIWVNLAKNPRLKTIDYPDLHLNTDLPKALALASIAIRLSHVNYDHVDLKACGRYMAVGGVFSIDLLAPPPPPKRLKGWTLRQDKAEYEGMRRLPYPLTGSSTMPHAGTPIVADPSSSNSQSEEPLIRGESSESVTATPTTAVSQGTSQYPPLRLQFQIPENILFDEEKPTVAWWNDDKSVWDPEGITGTSFDNDGRLITFHSMKLTQMAVVVDRYADLPYEHWMLTPGSDGDALFTLKTRHIGVIEITVVSDGLCYITRPTPEPLKHLCSRENRMKVSTLLKRLRDAGVNIMPQDSAVDYVEGIVMREADLEDQLARDLSLMAPGCAYMWSRWNRSRPTDKAVFRTKAVLDLNEPPTEDDDDWDLFAYQTINCSLVRGKENDDVFDEEMQEGVQGHANYVANARQRYAPAIYERCRAVSPHFPEAIRQLLRIVRVFSFSK